jgi:BirA family transcriptional regulator, biotin operon repressor / biotin---[acetyl-CoA-carboxylase] ligase
VSPSPDHPPDDRVGSDSLQQDPIDAGIVVPLLLELMEPGAAWVAGLPFEYHACVGSTNAALKQMADSARTGATVVTDEQTGGRGRLSRAWASEPGLDLTFSVLLRPSLDPARGHLLSLATGVAIAEVLEERFGLEGCVSLKWPNDVLLDDKKVCGILLEAAADARCIHWAVAGIGLNVNSEPARLLRALPADRTGEWEGRPVPVSLAEQLGYQVPRAPLLAALLARLTFWWTGLEWASTSSSLLGEWCRRDALVGRPVEVFTGAGRNERVAWGEAAGIGAEGQLLVRSEDGMMSEVFAGDVSVTVR